MSTSNNDQQRHASAQLATRPATTPSVGERELIIDARRDDWVRYEGTAAQLIAEGVIPEGLEWPRATAHDRWEANGFEYWLRRARPQGHKGPMRSWLEMDNWVIQINVSGRDHQWHTRQRLKRQSEELAAAYHHESAAGQREFSTNFNLYLKARDDKAFQTFKSTYILERKKPGRKPNAAAVQGAQP